MDYKERALKAEEGINMLNNGIFPNDILEIIKEKRLRTDLTNQIFSPKGTPKFNDLSAPQKKERSRRLKVELAFVKYMSSFESLRYSSILSLLIGLLTLFFWTLYKNGNSPQGIITTVESVILFLVCFKNEALIKYCKTLLVVFSILFLAEILVFQWPYPFFSGKTLDWYDGRRSTVSILINETSPMLYIVAKAVIIGFIGTAYLRIQNFSKEKLIYERG